MDILQEYLDKRIYLIAPRSIANDTVQHQEWFSQLNLVFLTFVQLRRTSGTTGTTGTAGPSGTSGATNKLLSATGDKTQGHV